ncbi:uncharacterized protein LOC133912881 [Phragmites australis]|uniref:uncharacterized protein LOC133912881 n=1 Tax=Phragmites australis TaxID=29695 RepID=UPI002D7773E6|nr:uncharacterized protein LOC133912881 [Phragmites australis]
MDGIRKLLGVGGEARGKRGEGEVEVGEGWGEEGVEEFVGAFLVIHSIPIEGRCIKKGSCHQNTLCGNHLQIGSAIWLCLNAGYSKIQNYLHSRMLCLCSALPRVYLYISPWEELSRLSKVLVIYGMPIKYASTVVNVVLITLEINTKSRFQIYCKRLDFKLNFIDAFEVFLLHDLSL